MIEGAKDSDVGVEREDCVFFPRSQLLLESQQQNFSPTRKMKQVVDLVMYLKFHIYYL